MKSFSPTLFLCLVSACCAVEQSASNADIEPFVRWLLDDSKRLEDVLFAEVAEAVSSFKVLPVDTSKAVDAAMLSHLQASLDAMLIELAKPDSPIHAVSRVNEISRHIEDILLCRLNAAEAYECSIPANAAGRTQRSGYPDLRLLHIASDRVFYIDTKVYKLGSEKSSFRSFYFEPKLETNKILDNASHLIVGIAHSGKVEGRWQLDTWKLIDLINFRVRLKAEFQSSNRELYRDEAVLGESR